MVRVYTLRYLVVCIFASKKRMQKNITIDIGNLLQRVRLITAYNADRNPAIQERYADAIMRTNDEELSGVYLDKAIAHLGDIIGLYAPVDIEREEGVITASLTLPSNFDVSAFPALEKAMVQYTQNAVIHDWLSMVSPQDAERHSQSAVVAIAEIRRALTKRVRPAYEDETPVLDTIELIIPMTDEA